MGCGIVEKGENKKTKTTEIQYNTVQHKNVRQIVPQLRSADAEPS